MLGQKHFVAGDKNLLFLSVYSNMAGEEWRCVPACWTVIFQWARPPQGLKGKHIESDVAAAHGDIAKIHQR